MKPPVIIGADQDSQSLGCPWLVDGKLRFEQWLRSLLQNEQYATFHNQLTAAVFPGRRIRPALLIKLADASRDVSTDALILELVHAASIVVDDILDADDGRRAIPNSILKVGSEAALTSHIVASAAWHLAFAANRATDIQSAYQKMCFGQLCDVFGSRPHTSWKRHYRENVVCKTTPLFELAFRWGLQAQSYISATESGVLGRQLGELFQMSNDLFDGTDAGRLQRNQQNYKYPVSLTLPLACFLDDSKPSAFRQQIVIDDQRPLLLKAEFEELHTRMMETGFFDEARAIFEKAISSYRGQLKRFGEHMSWLLPFLDELEDFSIWTKDYELMFEDKSGRHALSKSSG